MPARHNEPFMLDGGSTKSEGTSILLCECQQDAILGEYEMGLQLALKSIHCQTMKTIRPAVEKLHCCITGVDLIQCFTNSPLTEPNWFYISTQKFVLKDEHLFCGGKRWSWLLPNHPTIQFEVWKSKWKLHQYVFLASKNSKPGTTLFKYVKKKNKFITTLHYKFHKDQQISKYMREVRTIRL